MLPYIRHLDGVRAIAVLAVVANHFSDTFFPAGYLGVDVFFVISGFVITNSLEKLPRDSAKRFFAEFYSNRLKRILPAVLILVLTVSALYAMIELDISVAQSTGAAAAFGVSNIYLYASEFNYFAEAAETNPFTHTWSLGVEEQFYLLFPLAFLLVTSRYGRQAFFICVGVAFVFSVGLYFVFFQNHQIAAFYLLPFRAWQLMAGALTYYGVTRTIDRTRAKAPIMAVIAIALVACLLFLLKLSDPVGPALVTAATATFIYCSVIYSLPNGLDTLLSRGPIGFIGRSSYSIYLWHWPIVVLAKKTIGISAATTPAIAALIGVFSVASYFGVENRFRRREWGLSRGGTILASLTFSAMVCGGLFIFTTTGANTGLYTLRSVHLEKTGVDTLTHPFEKNGKVKWPGKECELTSNEDVPKRILPERCSFGDWRTANRRILVVGNSLSAALVAMIAPLGEEGEVAAFVTSSWGAVAFPAIPHSGKWSKANAYYWNELYPAWISQLRPGDIVVFASDLSGFSEPSPNGVDGPGFKNLLAAMESAVADLSSRGLNAVMLHDMPYLRE